MRRLASTAAAAAAHTNFSAELLCSAANRRLCIERLQGMPAIRLGVAPTDASGAERTAAVLVPLCTDSASGELSVLYTLRSARLAAHTGQVSFAGGMRDATDASFEACAVREAGEEIGLAAEQIDVSEMGQTSGVFGWIWVYSKSYVLYLLQRENFQIIFKQIKQ